MMHQIFSIGERSGLQVGQFSTRTLLLWSNAVVIAAVCGFALTCWNRQGLSWNRHHMEGSICCSKTFTYLSAFIVPSKTCKLPILYELMHPPYHQRCWLFNWTLIPCWKVSLLFSPEDKQACQIWTCMTIEHLSTLKQSILNGHDGASGPCTHMALTCAWQSFSWHL